MRHPPQPVKTTDVVEWNDGRERRVLDDLAAEEPLEIRIGGEVLAMTMRTPGDDFELAAGFLHAEGVVERRDDISRISYGRGPDGSVSGNVVEVVLRQEGSLDLGAWQRHFLATSSCGVCGRTSIDALRARENPAPNPHFRIDPTLLTCLPTKLRSAQRVFGLYGRSACRRAVRYEWEARSCTRRYRSAQRGRQVDRQFTSSRRSAVVRTASSGERSRRIRDRAEGARRRLAGSCLRVRAFESCRSNGARRRPHAGRLSPGSTVCCLLPRGSGHGSTQ